MKQALSQPNGRFGGMIGTDYQRLIRTLPYLTAVQHNIASWALRNISPRGEGRIKILDLGCGTGMTTNALLEAGTRSATIIGIDNEPAMIAQFERYMHSERTRLRNQRVTLRLVKADILGYLSKAPAKFVDVIVSGFTLHNLRLSESDRVNIAAEINRVLVPGGRFVNGDVIARDNIDRHLHDLAMQLQIMFTALNTRNDRAYAMKWTEHALRDNEPDLKWTESEIYHIFRGTGFINVKIVLRRLTSAILVADKPC